MEQISFEELSLVNGGFKFGQFTCGAIEGALGIISIASGNPVLGAVGIYYGCLDMYAAM